MTNIAREFDRLIDLLASLEDIGYGDVKFASPVQSLARFCAYAPSREQCSEIGMWFAEENCWVHVGFAYPNP